MNLKKSIQNILPPIIFDGLLRLRSACNNSRKESALFFSGDYQSWEEASARCTGYDDLAILTKVLDATLKVKRGEAVYERDSVIFDKIQYSWSVLAGLMWVAGCNGGRLNVLDFGGSLGSSFFENRKFLQALPEVRWNVVEQPHYVEAGLANIQDEQLRFYKTIEECLFDSSPNVVLLSSVLQYLKNPEKIINKVISINADAVILDRTIINHAEANRIYVQHVPSSIYSATYPAYSLSESLLIRLMQKKYILVADFQSLQFSALGPIDSEFKGYIFKRNNA